MDGLIGNFCLRPFLPFANRLISHHNLVNKSQYNKNCKDKPSNIGQAEDGSHRENLRFLQRRLLVDIQPQFGNLYCQIEHITESTVSRNKPIWNPFREPVPNSLDDILMFYTFSGIAGGAIDKSSSPNPRALPAKLSQIEICAMYSGE